MVTLDFSDCETVEDVNKKWLKYAKDIEPHKSLFKKLANKIELVECPICHKESEITNKKPVSPPEIERWTWACGHTHLVSVRK